MSKSGGLTELRKIAASPEPFQVRPPAMPHGCRAPGLRRHGGLDLGVPNFGIQESPHFLDEVHHHLPGLHSFKDHLTAAAETKPPWLGHPYPPFLFPVIRREDGHVQP